MSPVINKEDPLKLQNNSMSTNIAQVAPIDALNIEPSGVESPSKVPLTSSTISRGLTRKSTMATEPAKTHKKSYILACGASLSFGAANYFMSDLSMRLGILGIPCQCFGFVLVWALYYLYRFILHKIKTPNKAWFSKKES